MQVPGKRRRWQWLVAVMAVACATPRERVASRACLGRFAEALAFVPDGVDSWRKAANEAEQVDQLVS